MNAPSRAGSGSRGQSTSQLNAVPNAVFSVNPNGCENGRREMTMKKILMAAAATATLLTAGAGTAMADPYDNNGYQSNNYDRDHGYWNHDQDRDRGDYDRDNYRHDNGYHRGWYRHNVVDRWRVYDVVRAHHYRVIGEPYWYRGDYGV